MKEGEAELHLDLGRPTNGSLPNVLGFASLLISPRSLRCLVCMRVHDAALSCKLVQERLRKKTTKSLHSLAQRQAQMRREFILHLFRQV